MRRLLLPTAILISMLTGCAATVSRPPSTDANKSAETKFSSPAVETQRVAVMISGDAKSTSSKDWETFRAEWRTAFDAAARESGFGFKYFEQDVPEQTPGTALVKIQVNDYRYLTAGSRFAWGIMTGNAFVDADVELFELPAKRSLGRKKYTTSSTAWQGVFSAMTDKQVKAISAEIIKDIKQK
jgi:hypothetical protein